MQGLSASASRTLRQPTGSLPEAPREAIAATEPLVSLLREEIGRQGGMLPFSRYMALALYAPALGYYCGPLRKFGAGGDFVTGPELSPLFSQCLGRQCAQVLEAIGGGSLLEAGAGSGAMAADILAELARIGSLPEHYCILEVAGGLRQRQAATLRERVPRLAGRVSWLDGLPGPGFKGVVIANELLDAMPVHRLRVEAEGLREYHVGWQDGRFVWRLGKLSTPVLEAAVARIQAELPEPMAPGYVTEVGLAQPAWVRSVGECLEAGALLVLDYGFPRRELYLPQRSQGTLMCHYRHRAHANPLVLTGLQDITAHVDFTALAEAGTGAGLSLAGYTSQAYFLLANGLMEALEAGGVDASPQYLAAANAVKRLTLPGEMGELFKVMALARGLPEPLQGFSLQDRRGRL